MSKRVSEAVNDVSGSPDVYRFIRSIVESVKDNDAFALFHLGDIDPELYMDIINKVVLKRTDPKDVISASATIDDKILTERMKKNPSMDKIRAYRTQHVVYQDVLEFMATFDILSRIPRGRHDILKICRIGDQHAATHNAHTARNARNV